MSKWKADNLKKIKGNKIDAKSLWRENINISLIHKIEETKNYKFSYLFTRIQGFK